MVHNMNRVFSCNAHHMRLEGQILPIHNTPCNKICIFGISFLKVWLKLYLCLKDEANKNYLLKHFQILQKKKEKNPYRFR